MEMGLESGRSKLKMRQYQWLFHFLALIPQVRSMLQQDQVNLAGRCGGISARLCRIVVPESFVIEQVQSKLNYLLYLIGSQ